MCLCALISNLARSVSAFLFVFLSPSTYIK
nr:MAG TPA: hypothetical protein [Caudoviricetes sp.]